MTCRIEKNGTLDHMIPAGRERKVKLADGIDGILTTLKPGMGFDCRVGSSGPLRVLAGEYLDLAEGKRAVAT